MTATSAPAVGHAQALVVEKRAFAALGDEQLLVGRVVDHPGHHHVVALQPDRDGELRNAVEEVGGAVERVDDPAMGLVGTVLATALLAEKAVAGPRLGEFGAQDLLGAVISRGDEIGGTLHGDLQVLHLAEVALEAATGLARGRDHDVEKGGPEHG